MEPITPPGDRSKNHMHFDDQKNRNEPITIDSSDTLPLISHDDDDLNCPTWRCTSCQRFRGMIFAILSALFFSFQALLVAKIQNVHFTEITFFRMLLQMIFIIPVVYFKKKSFFGEREDWLKLLLRGIFGTVSMGGMYYAIQKMPLGEASVIRFSCPAFVGIIAFFVLHESCGIFEIIIIIMTFSGVVLIAQPPFVFIPGHPGHPSHPSQTVQVDVFDNFTSTNNFTDVIYNFTVTSDDAMSDSLGFKRSLEDRLIGSTTALVAAVAGSIVHVFLRLLRKVDASTVVFTYSVIGTLISAFLTTVLQQWTFMMGWETWLMMLGIGIFAVLAQLCFTWSLQEENAGTVSVLRTTEILFAFIYQTTLLRMYPNIYSIFGALLIASCSVAHGVRKWYVTRNEFEDLDEK